MESCYLFVWKKSKIVLYLEISYWVDLRGQIPRFQCCWWTDKSSKIFVSWVHHFFRFLQLKWLRCVHFLIAFMLHTWNLHIWRSAMRILCQTIACHTEVSNVLVWWQYRNMCITEIFLRWQPNFIKEIWHELNNYSIP